LTITQTASFGQSLVLSVRGLGKSFAGIRAVDDVSFDVEDNKITALIGPNGAGKTTVFNLITNLTRSDKGVVTFRQQNLEALSTVQIAKRGLIRTFQSARVFPGMTAVENVIVGRHSLLESSWLSHLCWFPRAAIEEKALRKRAEGLLELVGLSKFRDSHATELPMGAQKLLEIIRALMAQPRLLCLDEPAAGLNDSETAELGMLLQSVRDSGIPILLVEHNMTLVMNVADQVIVLSDGKVIAAGSPAEVRGNSEVVSAYLGRNDDEPY
jgi:branched-chain amino acid transport system ATP-binding protein